MRECDERLRRMIERGRKLRKVRDQLAVLFAALVFVLSFLVLSTGSAHAYRQRQRDNLKHLALTELR